MANVKENLFTLTSLNFKNGKQKFNVETKSINVPEYVDRYDPLIFCRTCANVDTCLVPIFKKEGLDYSLNKKIEKYLPIQVSEEDDLPVHLCYHCASTLIAWDTLVIGCVEAEKKLTFLKNSFESKQCSEELGHVDELLDENIDSDDEPLITKTVTPELKKVEEKRDILQEKNDLQILETAKNESSRNSSVKVADKKEETEKAIFILDSDDSEGKEFLEPDLDVSEDWSAIPKSWLSLISCKYCGKISCAPKHLRQHEKRGTCTRNFHCHSCGQTFTKELTLVKHLKRHQRENAREKIKKFTCSVCHKKFKFEDNGLAHEKICGKVESTYKCSVCKKRFETKVLADQHWTCHHRSCVCHMCGQSFSKPESLKQHVKTVHEEFKMVCQYCGKEFSRKARLQEHLQHHTGQMDFTCHICGKGSTNAYSFGVHLATHSQETPYSCSFCPRTFKHMKYVYLHERSVHLKLKSGKTYVKPKKPGKNVAQRTCSLCNKTFKRESAMLIHKRTVHEGKNGYICKLCGKDFKYTYLLYVHKKKHHFPELCKYICEFCEKPFPVKTELKNHLRKHTGEKPYVCGLCGKTYSFHGSLNMHMKTQHENKKNYKCTVCGSSYNFQSHLARHMSVHSEVNGIN